MNIYIDESGSFVPTAAVGAWGVVVAYVSPERDRRALEQLTRALRAECGKAAEAKLRDLSDDQYVRFLKDLRQLNGIAIAVATNMSFASVRDVETHRDVQADKVEAHKDRMHHEKMRQSLAELAGKVRRLPLQLYAQLGCQLQLFHSVISYATMYYAQRIPSALGAFRWRIDRKDTVVTQYEIALRTLLGPLLQSRSSRDPLPVLEGADYRFFERFNYAPEEIPRYLEEQYGHPPIESAANLGKIVRENFELVDSKSTPGVQVSDLLSSGLRRLLRGKFPDAERVAAYLGANMLQRVHQQPPVDLVTFGNGGILTGPLQRHLRLMERTAIRLVA